MKLNAIHSISDVTTESGPFEEPVAIEELKEYLRLGGFVDTDESTSDDISEFDFDDEIIADINQAARELMEQYTGITLIPKTLEVVVSNGKGRQELPGPVGEITEALDYNGDEIDLDDITLVGNTWKYIKCPKYEEMTITYTAGYGNDDLPQIPKAIKVDIMRLAAYLYIHRGDDPAIQVYASQLARKYKRNLWA